MSPEALRLAGALGAGLLLGALNAAGLWWTVRRLPGARHPGLLLAGSSVLRLALTLGPLPWVSGGRPGPLVAALVAYLVGRLAVVRALGRPGRPTRPREERG